MLITNMSNSCHLSVFILKGISLNYGLLVAIKLNKV